MTECKYEGCNGEVFEDSDYCILHVDLPEDENSAEFKRINELKEKKVQNKIKNNDFNFKGSNLFEICFNEISFKSDLINQINLNFNDSKVSNNVSFKKSGIVGNIFFNNSQINGDVFFLDSEVLGQISFNNVNVNNVNFSNHTSWLNVSFDNALINGNIILKDSTLDDISFNEAEIIKKVNCKNVKVTGNMSFNSASILSKVWFDKVSIEHDLSFYESKIESYIFLNNEVKVLGDLNFVKAEIDGSIYFREGGHIGENVDLLGLKKVENVNFEGSNIDGNVLCGYAKIKGNALFDRSTIGNDVDFEGSSVRNNVSFDDSQIGNHVRFIKADIGRDISFNSAKIKGKTCFHIINLNGKLNCKKTEFKRHEAQEEMCRVAKNRAESLGDKEEADNYFYREMEAKRLQKPFYIMYPEWIIQKFFGYGVRPLRVILTWLGVVLVFSIIYWLGNSIINANSFFDYLYFSTVTAATPGYAGYHPKGNFQLLASFEAIFGTFMWAAVIATFSRKYMK